jgi:pimeloyl-ACP methyl ester carboxylesterase
MSHARVLTAVSSAALVLLLALGASGAQAAKTTWLCKPGLAGNPCAPGLATTVISPTGETQGTLTPAKAKNPKIDCFYVYPTVSDQKTPQATRKIDPEERSIALYQAARYSSECRVYAPMYRQVTLAGLLKPTSVTAKMRASSYQDVVDAWRDYLEHDNKGRGVVLIGHSQGSFVLRQLIAKEIDKHAKVRKQLVSAILLGGNVLVKKGSDVGGDFQHIKACRSATQLRCVIAFSTFNATPPPTAVFGRADSQPAAVNGKAVPNTEVLCTNPAALGGGSAPITSLYPSTPFAPGTTIGALTTQVGLPTPAISTPWIEAQAYSAQCSSEGGANVLRITGAPGAPELHALPDATWGLHLVDANIALGDLVTLVHGQATRYASH